MSEGKVRHVRWDDMEVEPVTDAIGRRLLTGDRMMIAQVLLESGAVVPMHAHDNEQITHVVEGALRFWIGDEGAEPIDVRAGEVLHIPSNVPHKAEALADTIDVDIFSPPRQDWLDGTDTYFHRED